jgi:hypothetical protein
MTVVPFNKIILFGFLLSASLHAVEPVVLLSKLKFEKSLKDYENKISICSKGDNLAIPLDDLKPLKFTRNDWITVLIHLSRKSFDACVYDEKANFTIASNSYIAVSKHFKNNYSDIDIYEGTRPFSNVYSDLEYEVKYLQIDQNLRNYLSKIESLKHAFDPSKTLDLIEKSDLLIK